MLNANRNTTSIIGYSYYIAGQNFYNNILAVARQCFIYRVIHYLINEMVQSSRSGRTDIHTRALSYGFETFQHLYLIFIIVVLLSVAHDIRSLSYSSAKAQTFSRLFMNPVRFFNVEGDICDI